MRHLGIDVYMCRICDLGWVGLGWLGLGWVGFSIECRRITCRWLKTSRACNLLPNERCESFWDGFWLGIGPFLCFSVECRRMACKQPRDEGASKRSLVVGSRSMIADRRSVAHSCSATHPFCLLTYFAYLLYLLALLGLLYVSLRCFT